MPKTEKNDAIVDFQHEAQFTGREETIAKGADVTFTFVGSESDKLGAYLSTPYWQNIYFVKISAPQNIAVIEYQVEIKSSKTADIEALAGKLLQR